MFANTSAKIFSHVLQFTSSVAGEEGKKKGGDSGLGVGVRK